MRRRDNTKDEIMLEMFNAGSTLTDIAKAVGISKARAGQILGYLGYSVSDRLKTARQKILDQLVEYLQKAPDASIVGFYRENPGVPRLNAAYIAWNLRRRRIKLDRSAILSTALKEKYRDGRPKLTVDFLHEEYVEKGKSQHQLSKETGYAQTTIAKWIVIYGLNTMRSKRRKDEKTK